MTSEVQAIIFDCFGVLATDTWQAFVDNLPAEADVERAREIHRAFDAGLITKEVCAREIKAATGRHFTELDDIESGAIAKNTQLLSYIRILHEKGYKTSILSNAGSNWIRDNFFKTHETAIFDDFVLSYEVGMIKPDERMFLLAAERLDVSPKQAVLVDDKERYCTAAREAGMQAIWYKDFAHMKRELEKLL